MAEYGYNNDRQRKTSTWYNHGVSLYVYGRGSQGETKMTNDRPLNKIATDIKQLFTDMEIDEGRCPSCGGDNISFITECYEDSHHEMIEHFAFCYDCEWGEIAR